MKNKISSLFNSPKWAKPLVLGSMAFLMFFITPFASLIPVIGLPAIAVSYYTIYFLPLVLVFYLFLWAKFGVKKLLFSLVLIISLVISFRIAWLWLTWIVVLFLAFMALLYIFKLWKKENKIIQKILLAISGASIMINLYWTLNPFMSNFGFFGAGELITLNIREGYQDEKLLCELVDANSCADFENTKKYYCSLCVNDLRSCASCLFFWDNAGCNMESNKCEVGW